MWTKGKPATITALTDDKAGKPAQDTLAIAGVDDPPVIQPPENIDFASSHYNGLRRPNKAILIVNLRGFVGMPEIKFWLEDAVGKITLGDDDEQTVLHVKVKDYHRTDNSEIARVPYFI